MNRSKNPCDPRGAWIRGWVPYGLYIVFVIHGAVASPESAPRFLLSINDKVFHFVEYFILYWLGINAYARVPKTSSHACFLSLAAVLALGGLTEFLQLFAPGRSADVLDFAADAAAGFSAFVLHGGMTRLRRKK